MRFWSPVPCEERSNRPSRFWERYSSLVGRILRRVFGSSPDSVDLSQDVFLCVFQQMTKLRQPEALRAYIVGISLRVARNHLRRKKVRSIVGLTENVDLVASRPIADPDTRDAVRRLCRLLDGLTVEDRSLFVSRYIEGMRVEEIAALHAMTLPHGSAPDRPDDEARVRAREARRGALDILRRIPDSREERAFEPCMPGCDGVAARAIREACAAADRSTALPLTTFSAHPPAADS